MSLAEQEKKPRIWLDGCFDLWHFGHANALRQAKLVVPNAYVVAAVHPDEEIARCKGPPVMTLEERVAVVESCKWVDEVTTDAPYVTNIDKLKQHNIDFVVHGEDISTDEFGNDSFKAVKEAGMFRLIKRTDGVSTTDIVARMLLLTKSHLTKGEISQEEMEVLSKEGGGIKHFLTTSRKIVQFSNGKAPKPTDKIVYVDGQFDMFHIGHVNLLKRAKEMGDYLIAGIHTDTDINIRKGANYPILNLHERVLIVLACKYVDEVVIGAPYHVDQNLINDLKISMVVHGDDPVDLLPGEEDKYKVPKEMGLYVEVPSTAGISSNAIIKRIIENRIAYAKRNQKKKLKDSISSSNITDVPIEL